MVARVWRFGAVGLLGFVVQITTLWALMSLARWMWLPATFAAVELAIVHNFLWHQRWTWRDRVAPLARFVKFNAATGVTSIAGNAALMAVLVGLLGLPVIPANALAVATVSVANFLIADRWVFEIRCPTCVTCVAIVLIAIPVSIRAGTGIGPYGKPETVAAWDRYVGATEARLEGTRMTALPNAHPGRSVIASGDSIDVPSGTISDWRGSVFISGVTLNHLLDALQHPGTPPPQEDVASSRVLARAEDSLRVSIRLVRRVIVTVSYDTEHEMRFRRWTPALATARSVAIRIEEVGGSDHGFLWRLNSYWRYQETDGGVFVDLESLTLSRDVPSLIRPIAAPLVNRIARESMVRTLEALRRWGEGVTG